MADLIEEMKFTVLPGDTFKEMFGFFQFYKITAEGENEKNQPLVDGLNVIPLSQKNGYCDGGITFNIQDNLFKGLNNYAVTYKYIREVEIPDDAMIFIDYNSFRSDKLILKERKDLSESDIWNDINFCKDILLCDHKYITFIKNPPHELLDWLLTKRPGALEYIDNPPNDLVIKVLNDTPYMIRHLKNPTIEHYLTAYTKSSYSIQYIDIAPDMLDELIKLRPEIKELREKKNNYYGSSYYGNHGHYENGIWKKNNDYPFINKDFSLGNTQSKSSQVTQYIDSSTKAWQNKHKAPETEAESAEEIKKNPFHIRAVPSQTPYLCQLAFSLNKDTFRYIEPKYLNAAMCDEAVDSNYKMLSYVPPEYIDFMDKKIIVAALEKNGKLIEDIPNPTHEMCLAAVMNNPDAIYSIKEKPKDIIELLAKKMPKFYHLLDEIDSDDPKELESIISTCPTFYSKLKKKTKELTAIAVGKVPEMLKYVPEELQDEDLCSTIVLVSPKVFQYVINQTHKICLNAVSMDGLCLKYVKNKTRDLCWKALENNPLALEFISDQTEEMCLFAISKNVRAIEFVLTMTKNILSYVLETSPHLLKEAVNLCPDILTETMIESIMKKNGLQLKHVPRHLMSIKICYLAIDNNPEAIEYVHPDCISNDLILRAVRKNGNVIRFVAYNKQTEEVCMEAVKNQPNALRFLSIEKQTDAVCMSALEKDVFSFEFIKNKKPELCFYAVGKNPAIMAHINSKDEMLYQMCLCINPKALHYIRDIDIRREGTELLHEIENIILSTQ